MHCNCENCAFKSVFFEFFTDDDLNQYCDSLEKISVPKGKRFITQGDKIRSFKSLSEGLIKLHRINELGKEQIISFGKPSDFISIHNIFAEDTYSYSITTLEESTICIFDIEKIKTLIKQNGDFAYKMIRTTTMAANHIILNKLNLLSKTMYGKVAHVILFFHEEIYHSYGFDLPVSRKEIAQYTGLSIETVIRVLSEFRKSGLIKIYGKRLEIINKDELKHILKN